MERNYEENDLRDRLLSSSEIERELDSLESIAKLLDAINNLPITLRREFRGEFLWTNDNGESRWVQNAKPVFVKIDQETGKPIKVKVTKPWGEVTEDYVPNDEAIDEVISMLKFMGINEINPIGFNQPDNYIDDLKEFELKLAALLALKQKSWGIDKELLPMIMMKIKTLVQDVRSLSVKGNLIKALTTNMQRVEQYVQQETGNRSKPFNPY